MFPYHLNKKKKGESEDCLYDTNTPTNYQKEKKIKKNEKGWVHEETGNLFFSELCFHPDGIVCGSVGGACINYTFFFIVPSASFEAYAMILFPPSPPTFFPQVYAKLTNSVFISHKIYTPSHTLFFFCSTNILKQRLFFFYDS